jgi:hypothetical protein
VGFWGSKNECYMEEIVLGMLVGMKGEV